MIIYPAIDILDGKAVRLYKGDYEKTTIYGGPTTMANRWLDQGSKYLHLVDLNGAKQEGDNIATIKSLVKLGVYTQVGGGIRSLSRAKDLLDLGVDQVIIGTAALKDPDLLVTLVENYPNRVTVGVDALNGFVAIGGWLETSRVRSIDLIQDLEARGVKRIIYTDIRRDGTLKGPNIDMYKAVIETVKMEVVASGGISSLQDLINLKRIGLSGVVVGKALYEGVFTLREAIDVS